MNVFNFYDVVGVIAPGTILLICGVAILFPQLLSQVAPLGNLSVGGFGLNLILAYVAGQLLQVLAGVTASIHWRLAGGLPTNRIFPAHQRFIHKAQRELVENKLKKLFNAPNFALSSVSKEDRNSITRQIYAAVQSAGKSARVDIFGSLYGLGQGLVAAFFLLLLATAIVNYQEWKIEFTLSLLFVLANAHLHYYGRTYARELFVQYVELA